MRSSRWQPPLLLTALAFVLVLVVATRPAHATPPKVTTLIAETIVATWRCQDQLGVPRTSPSVPPWSLPKSARYRAWVLNRWQERRRGCLTVLHGRARVWRQLERGLQGTPMAGTARELERAGRRHHVHPAFIAAIAGTESSFGAAGCSGNPRNAFGLSSCTTGWAVPYFPTWQSAYEFMGEFLSSRWPHARTPYDYHGYAACSACWGAKTAYWMETRFGVPPVVHYT